MSHAVLTPSAFRDIDTDGEERFIAILCAVVNGAAAPADGAREIDSLVTEQSLHAYTKDKESDQRDDALRGANNWQNYLWHSLAEAAMALPPSHPGQDALIRLLQALTLLPKHRIPFINYYGEEHHMELWTVNRDNRFGELPSTLVSLNRQFLEGNQIDSNDSLATRYISFSSYHARLFGAHVANVLDLCPLGSFGYAITQDRATSGDDARALAAAQWIFHANPTLWEVCEKRVWNYHAYGPDVWKSWKAAFKRVAAADSGYGSEAQQAAVRAIQRMEEVEKQGVSGGMSIVDVFGLRVIADSDEEHDEEVDRKAEKNKRK